jgi:hypothetical protein
VTGGMAILETIRQASNPVGPVASTQLARVATEIAERIIVSRNVLDARGEVRITFRQDILPGTEVLVSRNGNQLNVNFVSTVDTSLSFLNTNQAQLREYLGQRLPSNEINITIRTAEEMDSGGSPSDGHSRNRYEYVDPDGESS